MGKIGYGYGSEWHLLWYLGRHRTQLNDAVRQATGAEEIAWLDFPASGRVDAEWKGLAFIKDDGVQAAWRAFWPQGAGIQNWDAVAQVQIEGRPEWLLVEAKAHCAEVTSNCGAKPEGGLEQIRHALDVTKQTLGVEASRDWMNGFYQFCNRLAVLGFLHDRGIAARLLYLYFTGDAVPGGECPQDEAGWQGTLASQDAPLGLPEQHPLSGRVHKVYLPAFANLHDSAGVG